MSTESIRSKFFGGRVCLDFANTLNWRLTDAPVELIPDYAAFLDWSARRGTLPHTTLPALRKKNADHAAQAKHVMDEAHALRAGLIKSLDTLRSGKRPDIEFVNSALRKLPPQRELVRDKDRFVFALDGSDLRQILWPVVWSLTAVLASSDAARIGACEADGCGWFFADESPNKSRLWCSDGCGNRERVKRSYARQRQIKLDSPSAVAARTKRG